MRRSVKMKVYFHFSLTRINKNMEENISQKLGKSLLVKAIILAAIIIGGSLIYVNYSKCQKTDKSDVLPAQQVADKAINYINQKILGGKATVSFTGVSEENGLYKIKFTFQGKEISSYTTRDGKLFFPDVYDLTENITPVENDSTTIGDFSVTKEDVCKENDKPIVYFFGSKSCHHCMWEKPVMESVIAKFGDKISFHSNIDTDKDKEIFSKYSTGGVPTLVLGCKYYRVGSGENAGQDQETKVLTALMCKLTNNQPGDVCSQVQDLISQIK